MKQFILPIIAVSAVVCVPNAAQAKGCVKGAVVGGVAGHYAHHHAVAGAMAGCVGGHYLAKRHALRKGTSSTMR